MATIYLRDLIVSGRHGVHPEEKATPQPFQISAELDVDTSTAQHSDDLADTIDYAQLRQQIISVVEVNSFNLIERLAQAIADELLSDKRIKSVSVEVAKPQIFKSGVPALRITVQQSV